MYFGLRFSLSEASENPKTGRALSDNPVAIPRSAPVTKPSRVEPLAEPFVTDSTKRRSPERAAEISPADNARRIPSGGGSAEKPVRL
jgi:hypothetical protein